VVSVHKFHTNFLLGYTLALGLYFLWSAGQDLHTQKGLLRISLVPLAVSIVESLRQLFKLSTPVYTIAYLTPQLIIIAIIFLSTAFFVFLYRRGEQHDAINQIQQPILNVQPIITETMPSTPMAGYDTPISSHMHSSYGTVVVEIDKEQLMPHKVV
jgi:hypothetical protein